MKKVIGQTVRDIRRGVNKKVLKVPSIEQKVLDATSNEPWGPQGALLADIAQASRNYHDYHIIMSVIWKRVNDTGKNWRHVFKALAVIEYLIANGSERIVDEIREHSYQISTLSEFHYIDSSGRDQGSNVRRKAQGLVMLVHDKDRMKEVRQKSASNWEKLQNSTGGGLYKVGSYDDSRNGNRGDSNGYGSRREREWGDDKYGRYGDRYGEDEDYRGRSRSIDRDNYGSRSRSSDRDNDEGQYSSRGSNAKADDQSHDGSVGGISVEQKVYEQNLGAPPSYDEAVGESRSLVHSERNGESGAASAPRSSSPTISTGQQESTVSSSPAAPAQSSPASTSNKENAGFDPRGSFSDAGPTSGGTEMDLLGSLSDAFPSNVSAPVPSATMNSGVDPFANSSFGQTPVAPSSASANSSQPFEDPFGDGPFRATPSTEGLSNQPQSTSEPGNNFGSGNTVDQNSDILAGILPPSGPSPTTPSQTGFPSQTDQPSPNQPPFPSSFPSQPSFQGGQPMSQPGFTPQNSQPMPQHGFGGQRSFPSQNGQPMPQHSFGGQTGFPSQNGQPMTQHGFGGQTSFLSQNEPQHGFQHQGGQACFSSPNGQPMPQHGFPPQGGQSGFSSQNGQPMPQHGFQHQSGQSGFSSQSSQPMPQHGFGGQTGFPSQNGQLMPHHGFPPQGGQSMSPSSFRPQGFPSQGGQLTSQPGYGPQGVQSMPPAQPGFSPQGGQSPSPGGFSSPTGSISQAGSPGLNSQTGQAGDIYGGFQPRGSSASPPSSPRASPQPATTGALAIVPRQPEKFETKSTVWNDTLNRGLVNLNISGPKTNPLSNIGIDFEAMNRKEKRMEKPNTTHPSSNVTMGKAMGSGSGIGRAGAGTLWSPPNPMMGPGMSAPGPGFGLAYGGLNQPPGMGMNTGQGFPPAGFLSGYNPMMGRGGGGYGQPPYGGYK